MLLLLLLQLLQKAKMSKPAEVRPTKRPKVRNGRKRINLALQGGGAHGAFTWGALDQLLADGRLTVKGISGPPPGALTPGRPAAGRRTPRSLSPVSGARPAPTAPCRMCRGAWWSACSRWCRVRAPPCRPG